ncbi:hypothetical protein [Microbacterium kunmingense]|uniref:hypothetical protein n=1 Tax=Microbacterium kunmingense TaxID=2915939 RepID=UPI00200325BA|nr:hypothetical protein [Microbacterium kunmingense]
MSRLIPNGAVILTPDDARVLFQIANLGELRSRYRVGNTHAYQLLTDITLAAFTPAAPGNEPRQETASEKAGYMTVPQVARAARQAARTVRLACQNGDLPAEKTGGAWIIRTTDAHTYITAHT